MYVRRLGGEVLRFRHRGWLLDQSFLFFDESTDSLWSQATGTAVLGPRKGETLERLPVLHTTWGRWKRVEPTTLVLKKPADRLERYRFDVYADYYARNGIRFGLAVCLPTAQRLYPLQELARTPVVNDVLGHKPLVVVYHAPSGTAAAYGRGRDEKSAVRFEPDRVDEADVVLREAETGRRWSGLTGKSMDAAGADLEPVAATQFVVRNFRAHFPAGDVYITRK